ncbi:MAG: hypothetical protein QXL96_10200 [Ignisphaera sp.]
MKKPLAYLALVSPALALGIIIAVLATIASPNVKPVIAQYVVGGELEAPQIAKGIDYGTLILVTGAATAAILIGLAIATKLREKAE